MIHQLVRVVVLAALGLISIWDARAQDPGAKFEVVVRKDETIAARDGTKLAADVYLPAEGRRRGRGQHPTLLCRTPYDKRRAGDVGDGQVVRRPRLRGRGQRLPRPVRLRGELADAPRRPGRRRRRGEVDRRAAVEHRQDRHVRHQLRRRHAARPGLRQPARAWRA